MRTLLPLFAVLLTAGAGHADMAVPGFKTITREVRISFAGPTPGVTVFAVCARQVGEVPTTGEFDIGSVVPGTGYWSRHFPLRLCAVPHDLLTPGTTPDHEWFEANEHHPRLRWSDSLGSLTESMPVSDPRERVVQTYRATLTDTAIAVERQSETITVDWTGHVVAAVAGAVAVAGVVALVVWLVRRRSVPRTTPHSGT